MHRNTPADIETALGLLNSALQIVGMQRKQKERFSAEEQRNFAVLLHQGGVLLLKRGAKGDESETIRWFEESRRIREEIHAAYPDSNLAVEDLVASLSNLSIAYDKRGNEGDSQRSFECLAQAKSLAEKLWLANQSSATATAALTDALNELAKCLVVRGDTREGLGCWHKAHEVAQDFQRLNPASDDAADSVSRTLFWLASFHLKRNESEDADSAIKYLHESLATVWNHFVKFPSQITARRLVVAHLEQHELARQTNRGGYAALLRDKCRGLLDDLKRSGIEFDSLMEKTHAWLKELS